jgi:hypothetical protein
MIGVTVREENGVDSADLETQRLSPQVGCRVHQHTQTVRQFQVN